MLGRTAENDMQVVTYIKILLCEIVVNILNADFRSFGLAATINISVMFEAQYRKRS